MALAGQVDDVLRRANGFYTYFAADIAYHRNKFEKRGFDKVINIWGADHHGHVARLKGALDALGLNGSERLDIVLMQLVKLLRDGEVVRMSKRTGKARVHVRRRGHGVALAGQVADQAADPGVGVLYIINGVLAVLPDVLKARLKLADETRSVLKNGLALLGVEAPEKM